MKRIPSYLDRVFAALLFLAPSLSVACPVCFSATPYRIGLVWATVFLLPIPFILTGLFAYWIIRDSKADA